MTLIYLAQEIRRLRERAGLSVEAAAELAECSARQVRRYEAGECRVHPLYLKFIKKLANENANAQLPAKPEFRFIDLFAGIGGMRLGFSAVGGQCVFTCEWDRYCEKTYRLNFPDGDDHLFGGDIREFGEHPERVPDHDVLLAGFPCQPFSIAGVSKKNALGRPHGFKCETQGTLFFEIERILAAKRPKAFLLENVKNLENHDRGRTFQVIMETLRDKLGYKTVQHKVISAEPWVPQRRQRIFIVGFREKSDFTFDDFDESRVPPKSEWPKLSTILSPADSVSEKYTLTEHLWGYLQAYKKKHSGKGNGFGFSDFGPNDVTRTLSARYFKDGSEILIKQPTGRPRRLTPEECARLMGFRRPDGSPFRIEVSDTQAYKQFGNAVVVPVVKAVAQHMQPHISQVVSRERRSHPTKQGLAVPAQ